MATRTAEDPAARVPVIVTMRARVDARRHPTRAGLLRALRQAAARTQAGTVRRAGGASRRYWLVNAFATRADARGVRALAADPAVRSITLDSAVRSGPLPRGRIAAATVDSGDAWGIGVTGAPEAWARGLTGAGVRVGIIDTGVDAAHPALAGRVVAWRDLVKGRPAPYDDNGHGTHTLGTIVGAAPIGMAPGAEAVVAKAMNAQGIGAGSDLLAAAEWMTDPDGDPGTADQPAVVNNSWTAGSPNDPWFRDMMARWDELDIVPVFAVGNTGPGAGTIGSPASYPESIAVGAVDRDGTVPAFSARGPVTWRDPASGRATPLVKPDLVAPGVAIASSSNGEYVAYTGTSMAAPHVTGALALLAQARPDLRGDALADAIRASTRDIGAAGPDADSGRGVLDVAAAVGAPAAAGPDTRLVSAPATVTRARRLRYRVATTGATAVQVRVDGDGWSAPQAPSVALDLPEGRHVVEIAAAAESGAVDTTPVTHEVLIDRTPPRAWFTWRARSDVVRLVPRVQDDLAGVDPSEYRWDLGGLSAVTGELAELRLAPASAGRTRTRLAGSRVGASPVTRAVRTSGRAQRVRVRLRVRDRAGNVRTVARRVPGVPGGYSTRSRSGT